MKFLFGIKNQMLTFVGRDASEAFEDVGHSDEARAMLTKMYLGDFHGEVNCLPSHDYFRGILADIFIDKGEES